MKLRWKVWGVIFLNPLLGTGKWLSRGDLRPRHNEKESRAWRVVHRELVVRIGHSNHPQNALADDKRRPERVLGQGSSGGWEVEKVGR